MYDEHNFKLPGSGQFGPHVPQFPSPPTWIPNESIFVEHQNPSSSWAQVLCVTSLYLNGITQFVFGDAPPFVLQILRFSTIILVIKMNDFYSKYLLVQIDVQAY